MAKLSSKSTICKGFLKISVKIQAISYVSYDVMSRAYRNLCDTCHLQWSFSNPSHLTVRLVFNTYDQSSLDFEFSFIPSFMSGKV